MKPDLKNFNWPLARKLADFSARAYREATATDKATDASALVAVDGGNVVVAFKGSSTPEDFLQDAKFLRRKICWWDEGKSVEAHAGFLEDFNALNIAVFSQVKTWLASLSAGGNVSPKIYITGHSLGGGIAILCALEFARMNLRVAAVITFGQPRVGNADFKSIYNREPVLGLVDDRRLGDITYHVINADDPVPLLPPLLAGYRDEGNEIFLPPKSAPVLNPAIGFQLISDLLGALDAWRKRQLAFVPHHFIKAYLERIQLHDRHD
jgi:predicted lipase